MDGREPFGSSAHRGVRRSAFDACYRLLSAAKSHRAKTGAHSVLASALGSDMKGKLSPVLYVAGIALAFIAPWLSILIYVSVAVMWLIPDRRIENILRET